MTSAVADRTPVEALEYITFDDVAAIRGPGRDGKPLAYETVWRWSHRGLGGVKLRFVLIGSQWRTTRKWLDGFFAGVARAKSRDAAVEPEQSTIRTPVRRKRDAAAARKRFEAKAEIRRRAKQELATTQ